MLDAKCKNRFMAFFFHISWKLCRTLSHNVKQVLCTSAEYLPMILEDTTLFLLNGRNNSSERNIRLNDEKNKLSIKSMIREGKCILDCMLDLGDFWDPSGSLFQLFFSGLNLCTSVINMHTSHQVEMVLKPNYIEN